MSHVTREWVMSHVKARCHMRKHSITSRRNESCQIQMSHVTCKRVTSQKGAKNHVTYEWVISHINGSCHMWMNHVKRKSTRAYMDKSCRTARRHKHAHNHACTICLYVYTPALQPSLCTGSSFPSTPSASHLFFSLFSEAAADTHTHTHT